MSYLRCPGEFHLVDPYADSSLVSSWQCSTAIDSMADPGILPPLSAEDGVTIAVAVTALWATAFVWKLLQRVF